MRITVITRFRFRFRPQFETYSIKGNGSAKGLGGGVAGGPSAATRAASAGGV